MNQYEPNYPEQFCGFVEIFRSLANGASETIDIPVPEGCRGIGFAYIVLLNNAQVHKLSLLTIAKNSAITTAINHLGSQVFSAVTVGSTLSNAQFSTYGHNFLRYELQGAAAATTEFFIRIKFGSHNS